MDYQIPTTPTKNTYPKNANATPSKIPSPSGTNSPKYRKRSISPPQMTTTEQLDLLAHTKSHYGKAMPSTSSSSHMTSFYRENIKELNQLQERMFHKKARLDELKDEMADYKERFNSLELKLEALKEEKHVKSQQIKLKQNELDRLIQELRTKEKFMSQGHELQLQQLKVKNAAEINSLEGKYQTKIDTLKYEKIKKVEIKRDELLKEVEEINAQILANDRILSQLLDDCKLKHSNDKEIWLREYQQIWTDTLKENEALSLELSNLETTIDQNLRPELDENLESLDKLKEELAELQRHLKDTQDHNSHLYSQINTTKADIVTTCDKKVELEEYVQHSTAELAQIREILIKEETMRRKLHNELQELRGNIRVFCRIRPLLQGEGSESCHVHISLFNDDEGTQSMNITRDSKKHDFKFDKIFDPENSNDDIFEEIRQLVQSSLDGYNVCIFAYGQTGSGKTYTMLHPQNGMIPSTLDHIFQWIDLLKERGWEYEISSQFIEIYNETIIDLLRGLNNDTEDITESLKHEIRHDQESQTTHVTNVTTCKLTDRDMVDNLLKRAAKLRSTAATGSNERSSRSHSVFIIKLRGYNSNTGEECQGTLNLVDLAGSERINASQVTGDRLRETQNINKSLSCLGDVIHALGSPDASKRHIPFRNSKLTYLLQYSLSGDSKTLMFVNISPCLDHVNETLNSLRFASKVNSTRMIKRI